MDANAQFTNIINELNPDPIAVCMALDVCPSTKYAKGAITALTVSPTSGPQGTTFTINMGYRITNTTGTGQIVVQVNPPGQNSNPFGAANTIQKQGPGLYSVSMQFQATPNQDNSFDPGLYQVIGAVCEGTCGSINRYAYTISQDSTRFSISK